MHSGRFSPVACSCIGYRYTIGPFGPCSATCGQGIMQRSISCTDESGKQYPETDCVNNKIDRPDGVKVCQATSQCLSFRFVVGAWGPCSRTCGGQGQRERAVSCQNTLGQTAEDSSCVTAGL